MSATTDRVARPRRARAERPEPRALRRRAHRRRRCGRCVDRPGGVDIDDAHRGHPGDLPLPSTRPTRRRRPTRSRCRAPAWSARCARRRTSPARSAEQVQDQAPPRAPRATAGSTGRRSPPPDDGRHRRAADEARARAHRRSARRRPKAHTVFELGPADAKPGGRNRQPHPPTDHPEEEATVMNPEMMEALQALAADEGISVDTLFAALADALESAYKKQPGAYEYAWVNIDTETGEIRVFAQELDEDGEPVGPEFDVTPDDFGRIAAQTVRQVMTPAHPRGRARAEVRGVRRPRGRHRHRHHPADRRPLHAARPRPGRGAAAAVRAGHLRAPRARRAGQGLHRRGPQDRQGPPDRGVAAPTRA